MKTLDLFCGAGGLALGFKKAGFRVTGVDKSEAAGETFIMNKIGNFIRADLSHELVEGDYDIIIGGPPCRPWANINTVLRSSRHPDYDLLSKFFQHIEHCKPEAFLMENVPALASKLIFKRKMERMHELGYSVAYQSIRYCDFGAATIRRRLIVFGFNRGNAELFFNNLLLRRRKPRAVKDVIWYLRDKDRGEVPDHEWPELKTIGKYTKYYRYGKYGWYVLRWDEPAPSFGNIEKTYILHPDSFNGGDIRVISIRESMRIMGFNKGFCLPKNTGMGVRYQMAVDSVSPYFSRAAANIVWKILKGEISNDS
jgi:DNA (cytosine-5)-methyltransferase 1